MTKQWSDDNDYSFPRKIGIGSDFCSEMWNVFPFFNLISIWESVFGILIFTRSTLIAKHKSSKKREREKKKKQA